MKLIISVALAAFLLGCGGGGTETSSGTSTDNSKITNGDKETQNVYQTDENGQITTIKLSGSSEDIAVSKDALFVAKGKDGIDIVKIGYNDAISSELITAIDGINAKSVSLSEDGKELYVVNEEGFVNVINISNISNPIKDRVTTQQEFKKEVTTSDKMYKFVPRGKNGLEIYNISNPSNEVLESKFNKANAYDVVLADADTKALIASGVTGMHLLDITTPSSPNMVVRFSVDGGTKGLSLDKEKGLLFVANGDKGVLVYYLNMILDKLTKM